MLRTNQTFARTCWHRIEGDPGRVAEQTDPDLSTQTGESDHGKWPVRQGLQGLKDGLGRPLPGSEPSTRFGNLATHKEAGEIR
jgi:hypothetical protein